MVAEADLIALKLTLPIFLNLLDAEPTVCRALVERDRGPVVTQMVTPHPPSPFQSHISAVFKTGRPWQPPVGRFDSCAAPLGRDRLDQAERSTLTDRPSRPA